MFVMITGGSGSGKSAFAEEVVLQRFQKPYFYIATMQPFGEETLRKIERHQKMRREKGFKTLECYECVSDAAVSLGGTVLLECVSNLTANVMFGLEKRKTRKKTEEFIQKILVQIEKLKEKASHLVVVTNEVFSDGMEQYEEETKAYIEVLGGVNQKLAELADEVYEVVYGIPIRLK